MESENETLNDILEKLITNDEDCVRMVRMLFEMFKNVEGQVKHIEEQIKTVLTYFEGNK